MRYAIETLEIELNMIKSTIRKLERMEEEMFQKHPGLSDLRKWQRELELAIEGLTVAAISATEGGE